MTATVIRDLSAAEVRDLVDTPAKSALDDILATRAHPNELYRAILEKRQLQPFSREDWPALSELGYVAQLLGVPGEKLAKSLGLQVPIAGGGGLTTGYTELYYVSIATGTQLATFTTEASLMGGLKHCIIPAGYLNQAERSLRMRVYGRLGSTGTPTFTPSARLINSTTFSAGGGLGVSTGAITSGSGLTLAPFVLDLNIIVRTVGAGGGSNSTLAFMGTIAGQTAFASPFIYTLPAANTAFTGALDSSATQYLYVSSACGTSNGSNLIQAEMIKVWTEN